MIVTNKKSFFKGLGMAIVFVVVLFTLFMPLFNGDNAFLASDKLFNSMSKGSTNYIPGLIERVTEYDGKKLEFTAKRTDPASAAHCATILSVNCSSATQDGANVLASCDLGKLLGAALKDAKSMFHNDGPALVSKYNIEERQAMYEWWETLKETQRALNNQKRFAEGKFVKEVINRGVEVGYNFYKIEPEAVSTKWPILVLALVFYVFYTLWWGFSIYFLAEGLGLSLTAGRKKEA